MLIHKFNTEINARAASQAINKGEGIPSSVNDVTTTYTDVKYSLSGSFYYIVADSVTTKYITDPTVDYTP
jgi:hypothetical protein